ncbi:MAG: flippase, partial [bacterium]|nr:flippase [bacterium]
AFSYALGIAAFLTIFSDIGINALITKEASRNPQLKDAYLSTAFFTKLGLLIVFISGVIIFFPHLTNLEEAAKIMPILIFVFAFDTLRDLGSAVSRALEHMQIEALVNIFTNLAIVVLGFIFLTIGRDSSSLAFAYAGGSGLGLIVIFYTLRSHFKNIFKNFNKSLIKNILVTAWPFGLMGLMGAIMLNTDIIMLGWLTSAANVGYYSAAQKPIQLLYILPTMLATSIFPIMARLSHSNPNSAKSILEKSVALAIIISLPLVIIGLVLAHQIITIMYGAEYIPAISAFKILTATLLIVYPSSLIGNAIFAYDQQKSFVIFVLVATLGNIIFNILLIPIWGIEGAAMSTVLTQLITNTLIWRKMKKVNQFKVWPQIKSYYRLIIGNSLSN